MTSQMNTPFVSLESAYREEVTANLACRVIAVREAQSAGFGGNVRRKSEIVEATSQAAPLSPSEVLRASARLDIDLPLLILQAFNFLAQEPMLECTSAR